MATLQTNPSSVPNAVAEWTRELNVSELGRVGYINLHYSNWTEASTAVPQVLEGSIIEIGGSMYVETADININTASQTVSAINWVIYNVSGSTATATLTGTAPTISDYDVDKGGFYDGSGNRYTGHYMYVSAAGTAYSNKGILMYAGGAMLKYRIDDEADDFVIDAKLDVKETLTVQSTTNLKGAVDCDSTLNVDGASTLNSLNVTNKIEREATLVRSGNSLYTTSNTTEDTLFDALAPSITVGQTIMINGHVGYYDVAYATRTSSTQIVLYAFITSTGISGSLSIDDGSAATVGQIAIAW